MTDPSPETVERVHSRLQDVVFELQDGEQSPEDAEHLAFAVSLVSKLRFVRAEHRVEPETTSELESVEKLENELRALVEERQETLSEMVVEGIRLTVPKLPERVTTALSLTPVGVETDNALAKRDTVFFAMRYLSETSTSLPGRTLGRLEGLDAALYSKYHRCLQQWKVYFESQQRRDLEFPHIPCGWFPREVWWRHPERFLRGGRPEVEMWQHEELERSPTSHRSALRRKLAVLATSGLAAGCGWTDRVVRPALQIRDQIETLRYRISPERLSERTLGRLEGVDSVVYQEYDARGSIDPDSRLPRVDDPYPDNFWWRHPEQFRPDADGPHVEMWHERTPE